MSIKKKEISRSERIDYYIRRLNVVRYETPNKSYEQELTDDIISIIHYYSMKSYSNRRKLNNAEKVLKIE